MLVTFLVVVTKYLMRSSLREGRFALVYSMRDTVHRGREAGVLRECGGWPHCPCSQEAEDRLVVASLPNIRTASISFKASPKRHHLPMVPQPSQMLSLAGDHMFKHRSLGDMSICLSAHLRNWCWLCSEEWFEGEGIRKENQGQDISHPMGTIETPHVYPVLFFLMCAFIQCLPTENNFISCWLFNSPVFK